MEIKNFQKVLCANRGEIAIRVFRACAELGIRTVAIFSEEDATHQHRYKADESYLVGRGKSPVGAYLAADEILEIAERAKVDAIHPGYGFLAENAEFAAACRARNIEFIGPRSEVIELLGDKISARRQAVSAGVTVVPGMTLERGADLSAAREFCEANKPIIVKAAFGGGGRGMRVVESAEDLEEAIQQASSEALAAFGNDTMFLEKYLCKVRHIEVQILGDMEGNLLHLNERDCSVQRRHQKVIEVAPAPNLPQEVRERLFADALKISKAVGYHNAGTVEFLVESPNHYFIEVNPRLQVEHTVTEMVTGVDLVQAQIRIAEGHALSTIDVLGNGTVRPRGFAIQCRVTTEDPSNSFLPDTGVISAYRSAAGLGVRLDTGDGYPGAQVSPHYDSLLVKVTSFAPTLEQAASKGLRALREFRIRGVKTNLAFLRNVLQHDAFLSGKTHTLFIDETPELFEFSRNRDRATKLLKYLGDVIVNGHPTIKSEQRLSPRALPLAPVPSVPNSPPPSGTVQILESEGPVGLANWVKALNRPLLTDTTLRDAQQSLLATRVRTADMLRIAPAIAHLAPSLFSTETWGGATFDVAYRFLNEDPWDRLRQLKQAMPNLLQQMLLRGANAVGYTSYPNNVVESFIEEAAQAGVDVFRVFDSLNDLDNMTVAVNRALTTNKVVEVCICYTGDVDNPNRIGKYSLDYYMDLAARIEDMGSHFLCVKDMAGLLRPQAARMLISALKERVNIPIHLHTHDTSGNGIATLLAATECGVDIVDVALSSMAGLTSQPSMNALVAALRGSARETGLANKDLQPLADYWEAVRDFYAPFECGLKSSTSEVYYHEIPGGQYSNLRPQVESFGLLERWNDVKHAFAVVNQLVGDIPKVTPSSKMVGDFSIFLVQNDLLVLTGNFSDSVELTLAKVLEQAHRIDFPQSVVTYFQGHLGKPPGGFPQKLQDAVLKGLPSLDGQPSDHLEAMDLDLLKQSLEAKFGRKLGTETIVSAALYPRVLDDYLEFRERHSDVSLLDTPTYFYGLERGEEIWVEIEEGKTLVISLNTVSRPDERGDVTVYFTLNGQGRQVIVQDRSMTEHLETGRKADANNPGQVGAPMPGVVLSVEVEVGSEVEEGDALLTLEAMKMETVVRAHRAGQVSELLVAVKDPVKAGDLLVVLQD
ncbi:MAG: pyruvate carboxylase [Planctomycetota bacterium]|jgi:pyruvate carboxylase